MAHQVTSHSSSSSGIALGNMGIGPVTPRRGSPTGAAAATALAANAGPIARPYLARIDGQARVLLGVFSRKAASGTRSATAVPDDVAVRRATLQALQGNPASDGVEILARQFSLEGAAVRAVLNSDQLAGSLHGGALTAQALTDGFEPALRRVLAHDNVYHAVNLGAALAVTRPFDDATLRRHGIGRGESEEEQAALRSTEGLCLTNDAYPVAIAWMKANRFPAAEIRDAELAHQAFKVGIATREDELEQEVQGRQVALEKAGNKSLLKPGRTAAQRAAQVGPAKQALKDASDELAEFAGASNHILKSEHLADHRRRAITSGDHYLGGKGEQLVARLPIVGARLGNWLQTDGNNSPDSWFGTKGMKVAKQAATAGGTQAAVSGGHWGASRNAFPVYRGLEMARKLGRGAFAVSGAVQAASLGASHTLLSNGPREGIQGLTELFGWARPAEPANVGQLYPSARGSALGADGVPVAVGEAQVKASQALVERDRDAFKARSPIYTFGNVHADNTGQGAFAVPNAGGGMANAYGAEAATSLPAKVGISGGGGWLMGTKLGEGQLSHEVDGKPAYVAAGRSNPRGIVHRMATGAQKLDMTRKDNRIELATKIAFAAVAIIALQAFSDFAGQKVLGRAHAAHDRRDEAARFGYAALFAIMEGAKAALTLVSFFAGLAVQGEVKKMVGEKGNPHAIGARLRIGWENVSKPGREDATSAYPSGTPGRGRQIVNNVAKGTFQMLAQPIAVLGEEGVTLAAKGAAKGAAQGAAQGAAKGVGALVRGIGRMRSGPAGGAPAPQGSAPAAPQRLAIAPAPRGGADLESQHASLGRESRHGQDDDEAAPPAASGSAA